jgi:hypothetical protein
MSDDGTRATEPCLGQVNDYPHTCDVSLPNFGIATGGKGLQAACCGLGWMTALNNSGLLKKTRYMSMSAHSSLFISPVLIYASKQLAGTNSSEELSKQLWFMLSGRCRSCLSQNFGHTMRASLTENAGALEELSCSLLQKLRGDENELIDRDLSSGPVEILSADCHICSEDVDEPGVCVPFEITRNIMIVTNDSRVYSTHFRASEFDRTLKFRCPRIRLDNTGRGFSILDSTTRSTDDYNSFIDETGILALLRRKVADILALCSIQVDIATTDTEAFSIGLLGYMALFGVLRRGADWSAYQRRRHVFAAEHWDTMLTQLREKRRLGFPLVYTFSKLTTLRNAECHVEAYEMNITFVFNGRCERFTSPLVTWRHLRSHTLNNFMYKSFLGSYDIDSEFPFIQTEVLKLSEKAVEALCNLSEWALDAGSPLFLHRLGNSLILQTKVGSSLTAAVSMQDDLRVDAVMLPEAVKSPHQGGLTSIVSVQSDHGMDNVLLREAVKLPHSADRVTESVCKEKKLEVQSTEDHNLADRDAKAIKQTETIPIHKALGTAKAGPPERSAEWKPPERRLETREIDDMGLSSAPDRVAAWNVNVDADVSELANSLKRTQNAASSSTHAPSTLALQVNLLAAVRAKLTSHGLLLGDLSRDLNDPVWTELQQEPFDLTLVQVIVLKSYILNPNIKDFLHGVDEFSHSSVYDLKNCLDGVPTVSVEEALITSDTAFIKSLPGADVRMMEQLIAAHRDATNLSKVDGLDHNSALAVRLFMHRESEDFPISLYHSMNQELNNPSRSKMILDNYFLYMKLVIKGLRALQSAGYGLTADVAYRGCIVKGNDVLESKYDHYKQCFRDGAILTMAGFTSVSMDRGVAAAFSDLLMFELFEVTGVMLNSISAYPQEREMILIPPCVFEVQSCSNIRGCLIVKLLHVHGARATYLSGEEKSVEEVSLDVGLDHIEIACEEKQLKVQSTVDCNRTDGDAAFRKQAKSTPMDQGFSGPAKVGALSGRIKQQREPPHEATETDGLPQYWDGLKQYVFGTGGLHDSACFVVARKVLQDCFREFKHEYPALVQWWFERSVVVIRNRFFGFMASRALTNEGVIDCGAEIKCSMCSDSKDHMTMYAHALRYLSSQNDDVSRLAHASIVGVSPDNFAKILDKKLNILLQAAAVILSYVYDTPAARGCMLETIDDFRSRYADIIVYRTPMIANHCGPAEEANLFFTCNLIRIAHLFIPPGRGKGRYIDMATQLTERRTYSRGGGHTVFSERREKIFKVETGVIPVPRARFVRLNTEVTLTSENVADIVARKAFQESSGLSVTEQQSETEYSIRSRPENIVSIAQEMFFEGELVAQSLESRLMLSSGQQLTASLDVVTSDCDKAEPEGVPHTGSTIKAIDIDPNEFYPLSAQNNNSTNRSLPIGKLRQHLIMNHSELSDIADGGGYNRIKRRNVGAEWAIVQQMDPDVVDIIPNQDVRQLFTTTRSMNAFSSTIHAPTASNMGFPPEAACSDPVSSYLEQPFAFPVLQPQAIQDTLFSSEASRSDPSVVFEPDEVFDVVPSSSAELDSEPGNSTN